MWSTLSIIVFVLATFQTQGGPVGRAQDYVNPILAGFYPDPSICRVGEEYYLVSSTFAYYPGIPVFRSNDLVHWQLIAYAIDDPRELRYDSLGVSRGIFAPAIRHHDGVFYVTCTFVDGGGNFVVTAKDPAGPWSKPTWLPQVSGIDPSLFFDEDGKAYLVYNSVAPDNTPLYQGHRTIRMRTFDIQRLRVLDDEQILVNGGSDLAKHPVWIEGPHIFKVEGAYYLIAAEGGTGEQHSEVVFKATSVNGPYLPYANNPILTQRDLPADRKNPITCTGHADFVQTPTGQWWSVFLGCEPYADNFYNTGRETFLLPVHWEDGWPVILDPGREVPRRLPSPLPWTGSPNQSAYGGDVAYDDEFTSSVLDRNWEFLRAPLELWFSLTRKPGTLSVALRPETCSGKHNPSFLGRRQQHDESTAETSMKFSPSSDHEKAGLLVFQNETHYYYLCKSLSAGKPAVQLYRSNDTTGALELLAMRVLKEPVRDSPIAFRIDSHGSSYGFAFSEDGKHWDFLKEGVDATYLSTRTAGGFVGCMYALYATSLGQPSTTWAEFAWFRYHGTSPSL